MYLLSGPVAGGLLNNYEARNIVVVGTAVTALAFALSTLSPNIYVHYLLYGVLGGWNFLRQKYTNFQINFLRDRFRVHLLASNRCK